MTARRARIVAAGGTLLVAGAVAAVPGSARDTTVVLVPPGDAQAYHAAFPDFGGPEDRVEAGRIERFEKVAGRPIAWAYFSNNWFDGKIEFPASDVEEIDSAGRVPFVRLMARSGFGRGRDPNFSMRSIAEGEWDPELTEWCDGAREAGVPLLAEFGTEVNGDWFPWNGRWNGAGAKSWGDPDEPDGAERFRVAFRRIVETCRTEGADDITWFFHVDVGGWPETPWNEAWDYYPGDDVVDWVGLSDYGPQKPGQRWQSFRKRMDAAIFDLIDHIGDDKPLAVLEYGAAANGREQDHKARWIARAAELVGAGRWPEIRALAYWHEAWVNADGSRSNLRIDSSRRVRRAYRRALGGPEFSSAPEFAPR